MATGNCTPQARSKSMYLYDTTLRDGSQRKGLSFSLDDKLKITKLLDELGVPYIEGGWPGSNPKDMEYFVRMRSNPPKTSKIVAFGSTRRVGADVAQDSNIQALLNAHTSVVTIVGKTWPLHVTHVLKTTLEENLAMIADSISYLKQHGKEVMYDAEHFFDAFRSDRDYALKCMETAAAAGADWLVLCDTNGSSLPEQVAEAVKVVAERVTCKLGVHTHNDCELAVANALAAVEAGAQQIQGTINGYGERCGNANLISLIPTLQLKMGYACVPPKGLKRLTEVSRAVSEIANLNPDPCAPYVGSSAFAHKAGLHASAVERLKESYEHVEPSVVGNTRQILVSELAGRSNIRMLAADLGMGIQGEEQSLIDEVKSMERTGFQFENAEGTLELMLRRKQPGYQSPFQLMHIMVVASDRLRAGMNAEAMIKLQVDGELVHTAAEGRGPVHAIDLALRKALLPHHPSLEAVRLADYKVRILDPDNATDATTRVLIEATCEGESWSTVGCSPNIIEASYQALSDSLELYLLRQQERQATVERAEVVA
ncbi:MAG TPA: citramalate synthase [Oculatellaceae cyanobacterium]